MKKIISGIVVIVGIIIILYFLKPSPPAELTTTSEKEQPIPIEIDYKNIAYTIDGKSIKLTNGMAENSAAPDSALMITTRYFGNEYRSDVNNDGKEDVVFLLTQETGGSGVFYYAVAALKTESGYTGSDGFLLGDRIAPQTIENSPNPRHKNVVVVNYAKRREGEPMTTPPSVGTSAYLKLDTDTMMWAIVEPNFEGEAR
ncbi:MAG: hypothetical protein V4606_01095 [Patescibacteria group bacterium]